MKYKKIKENKEFLIINKPSGLIVHRAGHIKEESLADQLLKKYPKLEKVGEDPSRPGIVHRLDKLVSGLMVIPKTQESFNNLKKQFQERQITKVYTALVYGRIEADEGEIDFPIKRSSQGNKMAAIPKTVKKETNPDGRQAVTEFEVIKKFINYTLLKVKIKTGRTHQIRVHLFAFGHSIVGDDLYSAKKTREKNKKLGLDRIFLAATKLGFKDLDGVYQEFEIGLPEELEEVLGRVK
ncbi:RluA family pseudouridine synthase [Candidatus Falkowbacteria bacterium CG11_big_fil_rev_8_21_14_0_20_39_10]|uniref:Pseudouridine synthase n=1 Tax=Candidatus Falkowbacteria bacterium CG11_big_fil_rev_8_21_14_0_20_39_10 TaxID=1974570 RepID=A0A2M6K8I5_9BACT|nr:MAG: RluA family pseudouridine synthase [Candidatus Falkowbacteria bacterium CG11_big_fil_rev_8_21_14_0_20_39_10]